MRKEKDDERCRWCCAAATAPKTEEKWEAKANHEVTNTAFKDDLKHTLGKDKTSGIITEIKFYCSVY